MHNRLWQQFITWLAPALELQLFITLCSLPLLCWWALPTSGMTIVGNLLFAPFLTVFLFFSTLICTATALGIPCDWLCMALNWWHGLWLGILQHGSSSWLIYSHQYMVVAFSIIAGIGLVVLHKRSLYQWQRIGCFSLLLMSAWLSAFCMRPTEIAPYTIPCGRGMVEIEMQHGQIYVTDHGALGLLSDAQYWIRYQLARSLIRRCGSTTIERFTQTVGSYRTYKALAQLSAFLPVKKVYYAPCARSSKKQALYTACLKRAAQVTDTNIELLQAS